MVDLHQGEAHLKFLEELVYTERLRILHYDPITTKYSLRNNLSNQQRMSVPEQTINE